MALTGSSATEEPDREHAHPGTEALRKSLAALIEESRQLRLDVADESARNRRANRRTAIVAALFGLMLVGVLVVAYQNNTIARQTADTNQRMADCTTPGGHCYDEGKTRTGQAIGDIIRATIYMAECARERPRDSGPDYNQFLEACVEGKLRAARARDATPAPTPPAPAPSTG